MLTPGQWVGAGAVAGAMYGGYKGWRGTKSNSYFQLNDDVTDEQISSWAPGTDVRKFGRNVTEPATLSQKMGNGMLGVIGGGVNGSMAASMAGFAATAAYRHRGQLMRAGSSAFMKANQGFNKIRGLFR